MPIGASELNRGRRWCFVSMPLAIRAIVVGMSVPVDTRLHVASKVHAGRPKAVVREPWSGALLAEVDLADTVQAEAAARAASALFATSRKLPSYVRKRNLLAIAKGIEARSDVFAELIAREAGKPIRYARTEVLRTISTFTIAAEEATRLSGATLPMDITRAAEGLSGYYTHVARGPVLAITPFNFPLNLVAHKVAPALAVGSPVVCKPAPQTPLSALLLAEIVRESGFAEDMLQVLPCEVDVAQFLVQHASFSTLSFTGSERVGYALRAAAPRKHTVLELGGNAAAVVHEDAPPGTVQKLVQSAFAYAGQVCVKTQRIFVHRPFATRFLESFVDEARLLAPDDPMSADAILASVIDEGSAQRVERWVDEAIEHGATPLVRGRREGNRSPVTVLAIDGDGVGLAVVEEEVFGPVVTVQLYDEWPEALRAVNRSRYGIHAAVFTDSLARVQEAYEDLVVGGVVVNDSASVRVDHMPYGGVKSSGQGREGVRFAMEEMCDKKMLIERRQSAV